MKKIKPFDEMTDAEFEAYGRQRKKILSVVRTVLAVVAIALAIDGFWQHNYYIVALGVAAGVGYGFFKYSDEYQDID